MAPESRRFFARCSGRRAWQCWLAGLLLSLATGPMLGQLLFGLSPFDPIAFGVVAGILTIAGFVATFIPARRALSVDPATTLRAD